MMTWSIKTKGQNRDTTMYTLRILKLMDEPLKNAGMKLVRKNDPGTCCAVSDSWKMGGLAEEEPIEKNTRTQFGFDTVRFTFNPAMLSWSTDSKTDLRMCCRGR
jgi:hypothetical protein